MNLATGSSPTSRSVGTAPYPLWERLLLALMGTLSGGSILILLWMATGWSA